MSLAFLDTGPRDGGNTIVFLHAFPLNQGMWQPQVAEFGATNRVITLDWPGFGASPLALPGNQKGMEGYAASLCELLDQRQVDSAHICGLSMGGYVAFALCRLAPERVRALILCDTRAGADSPEVRQGRLEMAKLIGEDGQHGLEQLIEAMLPRLLSETTRASNPGLVEEIREMMRQSRPEGVCHALHALAERCDSSDLTELIGAMSTGATIIVGADDRITTPAEMRQLADRIRGASLVTIEKAGHLPNLEQSNSFNEAIWEALRRSPQ